MNKIVVILCFNTFFLQAGARQQRLFELRSQSQKYENFSLTLPQNKEAKFSVAQIESREFVVIKAKEWKACHQNRSQAELSSVTTSSEPGLGEGLDYFLEGGAQYNRPQDLEIHHLMAFQQANVPWSGDYWATARGILAARNFDVRFNQINDWLSRFSFYKKNTAPMILDRYGRSGVRNLSPSEKYDLIVGDNSGSLTKAMWAQGKKYYDEYGKVEDWMGICHGWAPASYMEPRPTRSFNMESAADGWPVKFFPAEIKGLVSYSWATNYYQTKTLGKRCYKKNPDRDGNGRLTDPECLDLNPAAWHLAITNELGGAHRTFIMDVTYDYEVWNQPVFAYSYTYFNPKNRTPTTSLDKAIIKRSDFKNDIFARYRSSRTDSLVGVTMKVGYVVENGARDYESDSPRYDQVRWVEYDYDLELDRDGNIIGGEWYQIDHPDFIWSPVQNAQPQAYYDRFLEPTGWPSGKILPSDWRAAALKSSPGGIILQTISDGILRRSISE